MSELVVKIGYGRPISVNWLSVKQVEDALDSYFHENEIKFEVVRVFPPLTTVEVSDATKSLTVQLKHILDELGVPSSSATPEGLAALVSAIKN